MWYVGDVHGRFAEYKNLIRGKTTFQVGDMGVGFPGFVPMTFSSLDVNRHRFLRGNHDNPEVCRQLPHYAGDFGEWNGVFFISGGFSIDRAWRHEGVDWWADEELSYAQWQECFRSYSEVKPECVASHECPGDILPFMVRSHHCQVSSTGKALGLLLEEHRPKLWVFGHHHMSFDCEFDGTRFVCLSELEIREL